MSVEPVLPRVARRLARILGFAPRDSRQFLFTLLPKHGVCAEIGVHTGDFSARILRTASPHELHLIDPWRYEDSDIYRHALYGGGAPGGQEEMDQRYRSVCARFRSDVERGRVTIHRGRSSDVLPEFPDGYFDWVYLDGNHLYEFVTADLQLSLRKVKPGGLITGDDYDEGGWWRGGVLQAVNEFVKAAPVERIVQRNRQFVLRRR